jgi:hypothetical protein
MLMLVSSLESHRNVDNPRQASITVQVAMATVHDGAAAANKHVIFVLQKLCAGQHYANLLNSLTIEWQVFSCCVPFELEVVTPHFGQVMRPDVQRDKFKFPRGI